MKIIFLTQYFPPETGAPQNRLFAMAKALVDRGAEVTVLTAMPNYPDMRIQDGYRGKWHLRTQEAGMTVHRVWLLVSQKRSILWRLANYFSFVFTALVVGLFRLRRSDVLLVESPPLFLGITAMLLARIKGARLVFNVSDLWPESAVQLGLVTNRWMIGASTWLEELCYRKASLITGQTKGIVANIQQRMPHKEVLWVPNGVDLEAIGQAEQAGDPDLARTRLGIASNDLVLTYAGIIGHAQGLEVVLQAADQLKDRRDIHFLLIGDGPEKAGLLQLKERLQVPQVHFVDRMPRADLLALLRATDAVVVPLRRNDLFKGAIPSKIFEALALSKPMLLGVEGEARELFIEEGRAGIAFDPENAEALAASVLQLDADREAMQRMGSSGKRYVLEKFDRQVISGRLWEALQRMVSTGSR